QRQHARAPITPALRHTDPHVVRRITQGQASGAVLLLTNGRHVAVARHGLLPSMPLSNASARVREALCTRTSVGGSPTRLAAAWLPLETCPRSSRMRRACVAALGAAPIQRAAGV